MRNTAIVLLGLTLLTASLVVMPAASAYKGCGNVGAFGTQTFFETARVATTNCINHAEAIYCAATKPGECAAMEG